LATIPENVRWYVMPLQTILLVRAVLKRLIKIVNLKRGSRKNIFKNPGKGPRTGNRGMMNRPPA
jgi:hypothetical protein